MKLAIMKTQFTLSDATDDLPKKFTSDSDNKRISVVLSKDTYLFGVIPIASRQIATDIYTGFTQAKESIASRKRDNANIHSNDKETRVIYGAVMGLAYGRMLNNMSNEEKAALSPDDTAAITEDNAIVKNDFRTIYGTESLHDVRRSVFKLFA